MREGYVLKGWLARGHWTDVGSPASLRQAERWKLDEIPYTSIRGNISIRGGQILGPVVIGDSVSIGENSHIIGPASIGAGTTIGDEVLVGPYTSIGENCTVCPGAKIFSSSVYNHVIIGKNSTASGSIIDNETVIGDDCSLEHDTVIGPRVVLGNRSVIHSKTRLWPEVVVQDDTIVKEHLLNEKFDGRCEGS
jgi:mannose-1-phosphate guanylyltransferase